MRNALTAGPQHAAKAVPPTVAPAAANVNNEVGSPGASEGKRGL